MEEIINDLSCPVCMEFNNGKYFMGECCHIVCGNCKNKIDCCPLCRVKTTFKENYLLKNIAQIASQNLHKSADFLTKKADMEAQLRDLQSKIAKLWIKKRRHLFDINVLKTMNLDDSLKYILAFDKIALKESDLEKLEILGEIPRLLIKAKLNI